MLSRDSPLPELLQRDAFINRILFVSDFLAGVRFHRPRSELRSVRIFNWDNYCRRDEVNKINTYSV